MTALYIDMEKAQEMNVMVNEGVVTGSITGQSSPWEKTMAMAAALADESTSYLVVTGGPDADVPLCSCRGCESSVEGAR